MIPRAVLIIAICTVSGTALSQSIALFGFEIGKKQASVEGLRLVQEETDYFYYARTSTNKEFLTQGIGISKLSRTIVSVNAMAPYQTEAACSRQVAEIVIQLNNRFPGLTEKITEAGGTVFHVLSRNRANCSWKTTAGNMNLTVPCSCNFTVYCSGGRSLFLEASDTGYRAQAREEAKEYALKSGRKQLD
jgi:hypothetical protein